jgi:hypothetical protein
MTLITARSIDKVLVAKQWSLVTSREFVGHLLYLRH